MARRGSRRDGGKERFWRRLLRQWRRSGLTVRPPRPSEHHGQMSPRHRDFGHLDLEGRPAGQARPGRVGQHWRKSWPPPRRLRSPGALAPDPPLPPVRGNDRQALPARAAAPGGPAGRKRARKSRSAGMPVPKHSGRAAEHGRRSPSAARAGGAPRAGAAVRVGPRVDHQGRRPRRDNARTAGRPAPLAPWRGTAVLPRSPAGWFRGRASRRPLSGRAARGRAARGQARW